MFCEDSFVYAVEEEDANPQFPSLESLQGETCYNNDASVERKTFLRTLVEFTKKYPYLYGKSTKGYSKPDVKADTWEEIARLLSTYEGQYKGDDISKLFLKLREKFGKIRREEAKSSRSGAAASDTQKTDWFLYNDLKFLDEHIQPRATSSSSFRRISESEPASSSSSRSCSPLAVQRGGRALSPALPRCVRTRGPSPFQGKSQTQSAGLRTYGSKRSLSQGSVPQAVGYLQYDEDDVMSSGMSGPSSLGSLENSTGSSCSGGISARQEAAQIIPKKIVPTDDIVKRRKRKSESDRDFHSEEVAFSELSNSLKSALDQTVQPKIQLRPEVEGFMETLRGLLARVSKEKDLDCMIKVLQDVQMFID